MSIQLTVDVLLFLLLRVCFAQCAEAAGREGAQGGGQCCLAQNRDAKVRVSPTVPYEFAHVRGSLSTNTIENTRRRGGYLGTMVDGLLDMID